MVFDETELTFASAGRLAGSDAEAAAEGVASVAAGAAASVLAADASGSGANSTLGRENRIFSLAIDTLPRRPRTRFMIKSMR